MEPKDLGKIIIMAVVVVGLMATAAFYQHFLAPPYQRTVDFLRHQKLFEDCAAPDLQRLEVVANLPKLLRTDIDKKIAGLNGAEMSVFAFALNDEEESDYSDEQLEKISVYVLKIAAELGDPLAMNEMGAFYLYCYQGVQQDIDQAVFWLTKAVALGEVYAHGSLGRLYLLGLGGYQNREAGMALIKKCAELGDDECTEIYEVEH